MTKPKKDLYRIQYADNTYMLVDWDKYEFAKVGESIAEGKKVALLDKGIFVLSDIRTVVYIPPLPEPTEEEKAEMKNKAESELSEWGFVDPETAAWLKANGIDDVGGAI